MQTLFRFKFKQYQYVWLFDLNHLNDQQDLFVFGKWLIDFD